MSNVPAVLVCDAGTASLEIAGLSVLDRMVVTAHRAGCAPIVVVCETAPLLQRASELGIAVVAGVDDPGRVRTPTGAGVTDPGYNIAALRMEGAVLVETQDIEHVIAAGGQLVSNDGSRLPVRMDIADAKPVLARGLAHAITDAASAREAERKLWASLTSSADGIVDRFFNRPIGRLLSKLLVHTSVSPNQVSIVSVLIGMASAWFFARGQFLLGAIILQVCAIVDCVDGDLARALFKQSPFGKWIDLGGDQVVHFCVFAGLGLGVARTDPATPALLLGASAAAGVLLCFAVIMREMRRPPGTRNLLLDKLLEAMANRDFSVLVLLLALIGRIDLFLWMAGIGVHVFWLAALLLRRVPRAAGGPARPDEPA